MPEEPTHRLILYIREYADNEDRGIPDRTVMAKPIPVSSLIDKVKRVMAIQGWKLTDAEEKGAGKNPRDKNGRWKKRGE